MRIDLHERPLQYFITLPMSREKTLESAIMLALRNRGFWCQKIHSGAVFVKAGKMGYKLKLADEGTPDIISVFRGLFIAIEVKKDADEQRRWEAQWQKHLETGEYKESWHRSIVQHQQHEAIMKAGGVVIVCSSIDELLSDIGSISFPLTHDSSEHVEEKSLTQKGRRKRTRQDIRKKDFSFKEVAVFTDKGKIDPYYSEEAHEARKNFNKQLDC